MLYAHEDTEWTTFHATDKTTPEAVEADVIEPMILTAKRRWLRFNVSTFGRKRRCHRFNENHELCNARNTATTLVHAI